MEETEYDEVIEIVTRADPILREWAHKYGGIEWNDYLERLRMDLSDQLILSLTSMRELEPSIY